MIFQPSKFRTNSLSRSPYGDEMCAILAAAINNADAGLAIRKHVHRHGGLLTLDDIRYDLNGFKHIYVIGVGKASLPMVDGITGIISDRITSGMVITKDDYLSLESSYKLGSIKVLGAGHPIPDGRNLEAGLQLLSLVRGVQSDDLVIILLSGGGSALLMHPSPGISLEDIQATTGLLLKCGATISEINTIRKHLDDFKGGGLAKLLFPATVLTLILSDVVGDSLAAIASGPTVADPTTYGDAGIVLNKYQLMDQIPSHVQAHIQAGTQGKIPETNKPGDLIFSNVTNKIVGNNIHAVRASEAKAKALGFTTQVMTISLQDEASQVGQSILEDNLRLLANSTTPGKPACTLAGGETTVTIRGNGLGGRNQELALGAVTKLSTLKDILLISLATDGVDGPTDAAGAVSTGETYLRGMNLGLDPGDFLARNDAYHYFELLGDLIKTGPTLTNVNDLVFIFSL